MDDTERLHDLIAAAKRIVAFTGAGISTARPCMRSQFWVKDGMIRPPTMTIISNSRNRPR